MSKLYWSDEPSTIAIARELSPGTTTEELVAALGEPDGRETGNGHVFLLFRNPPLAASYHTVAEVDPVNGLVLSLVWGTEPDDRWTLDPTIKPIVVPDGDSF